MAKLDWKPGNMIAPVPAVMVSMGASPDEYNIITIAWTGTLCSDPPLCYISVRQSRHSWQIIKNSMAYVINLTTRDLARAADWCGVRSGRQFNKFREMKLTPAKAKIVNAPIIDESPVNIECIVKDIIPLGTHDMFLSEIVHVQADEQYIDPQTGAFHLIKSHPVAYLHGHYFELGHNLGRFGFSVEKKKHKKPRE